MALPSVLVVDPFRTPMVRMSNEVPPRACSFLLFSLSQGVARLSVIARIEGPLPHRGASASTEYCLAAPYSLFRHKLQEVLLRQEAVLALKLVPRVSQFLDDAVPRDEMVFRKSEFAGSFIGIKVDVGDARDRL